MNEMRADAVESLAQRAVRDIDEAYQAQLLAAHHKLVEAPEKVDKCLEDTPQQVGHENRDKLEGQGVGTLPHRGFDFAYRLHSLPPMLDLPLFLVQPRQRAGRQVKAVGQHKLLAGAGS